LNILEELKELSKQSYVPPYGIGLIYTALGDSAGALEWFKKAHEAQNAWLNWIKVPPKLTVCVQTRGSQTYCFVSI